MNETKLTTPIQLSQKYKALIESAPDVEIITPEGEKGMVTSGKRYEVEFIVIKGVPKAERDQTKRAWNAVIETRGEVIPELVAGGLNRGYYKVPIIAYRLNDSQYFSKICEDLIFDSKQSDNILAAYYRSDQIGDQSSQLLELFGAKSIAFGRNQRLLPTQELDTQTVLEEADMILKNPSELGVAAPSGLSPEVVKFTAIFMEEELEQLTQLPANTTPSLTQPDPFGLGGEWFTLEEKKAA